MERLNYQTLKNLGSRDFVLENAPERVLQFGEGNFLRGFVDYFFDKANESGKWQGKVAVVQPIAKGLTQTINEQQGAVYAVSARKRKRRKNQPPPRDFLHQSLYRSV